MRNLTPGLVRCLATALDHRSDNELLNGFLSRHSEADFAELVRRYGPMVWGTCRRALPDHADAEDAFQTAFLVLVQRASHLTNRASIGPWLHRVALWTARNIRRRNARQLARRVALPEQVPGYRPDTDLALDVDSALNSLPENLRSSILLCHVGGLSRAEAATRLGCSERTIVLWLGRGLARLRLKLRGLDPAKVLAALAIAVPVGLGDSAVRAAMSIKTVAAATAVLSPTIVQLVNGVVRMFWIKKATAGAISLVTVFALGVGIGLSTRQVSTAAGGEENGQTKPAKPGEGASPLAPPTSDIDKQLAELNAKLWKLQAEAEMSDYEHILRAQQRKEAMTQLKMTIENLRKERELLSGQKPGAGKTTGAYLQLTISGKDAAWPFLVKEIGPDGKTVGTTAFENTEVFGRYLSRTLKDPTGPRELRVAYSGGPADLIAKTFELCKATGMKMVVAEKAEFEEAARRAIQDYNTELDRPKKDAVRSRELDLVQEDLQKQIEHLVQSKKGELDKLEQLFKEGKLSERLDFERQKQMKLIQDLEQLLQSKRDDLQKLKARDPLKKPEKDSPPLKP
jgi:RNA polymerase sigma factor (sigma-70 family)